MKKITKMLFSSALSVMLLFTGCGKNSGTEITNPPSDLSANNISEAEISSSSARVSVKDTDFIVNDKSFWINGANTPWQHWNDFEGNMDETFWDNEFAKFAKDNINCTRIWINCNGEGAVKLDADGNITSINENTGMILTSFLKSQKSTRYMLCLLFFLLTISKSQKTVL